MNIISKIGAASICLCVILFISLKCYEIGYGHGSQKIVSQAVKPSVISTSKFEFRVSNVHDGDTMTGTIVFPWNVALVDVKIRAVDYDAYEISRTRKTVVITDDEIAKGKMATIKLRDLCQSSRIMVSPPSGNQFDVYGRNLVYIFYQADGDGPFLSLSDWMKDNDFIRD